MINFLSKTLSYFGYTLYKNKFATYGQNLWHDLTRVVDLRRVRYVMDVGAFRGDMANFFVVNFSTATIIAIEPSPDNYQLLEDRFSTNPRVIPKNYGVGNINGISDFKFFENGELNSFKEIKNDESSPTSVSKIQVKTISNIIEEDDCSAGKIDFLKIDVEGFEMECLEGAEKLFDSNNIGMIYIESGFCADDNRHTSFELIFRFLTNKGFSFYGLYDYYHYRKPTELLFCNALFLNESYLKFNNLLIK